MLRRLAKQVKILPPFKISYREARSLETKQKELIKSLPETQYSALDNGLVIATEERSSPCACFGLYIEGGSRFEDRLANGAANFLEYVVLNSCAAAQLNELGARVRAITTREVNVYYVECLAELVCEALKRLSCAIFTPYSIHQLNAVRPMVFKGLEEHETMVTNLLDDYLHATAFQGTNLAHRVMGNVDNIARINDAIIARCTERFIPNRMVLAAVGGIKHEAITSYANCILGHLKPDCVDQMEVMCGCTYRYTGSDLRFRDDSMNKGHVAIAVEGPSFCEGDRLAMEMAACCVGSWDRSQNGSKDSAHFLTNIAFAENVADAYSSFYIPYKDTGLWGMQFTSDSVQLDDFQLAVTDQWMKLSVQFSEGELERARNEVKTKYLSQIAGMAGACHDIGRWTLQTGSRPSPTQKLEIMDKTTVEAVRAACFKYLYDKCPAVAGVGAVEGLADYARIRACMYWLKY